MASTVNQIWGFTFLNTAWIITLTRLQRRLWHNILTCHLTVPTKSIVECLTGMISYHLGALYKIACKWDLKLHYSNKTSNMSVLYYEPLYEIERFFDEAFSGRHDSTSDSKGQRRIGRGEGDSPPRSLKPRYVPKPSLHFPFFLILYSSIIAWTSTKTLKRTA